MVVPTATALSALRGKRSCDFCTGAWAALRRRALNRDVLIAPGTSVAYLYNVVDVFAPQLLPVGIDERAVYFEVSAVVIAFVLKGNTMEETIKQRCSAAVRGLLDLQPATATVIRAGQEMRVPAEAVQRCDLVLVRRDDMVRSHADPLLAAVNTAALVVIAANSCPLPGRPIP